MRTEGIVADGWFVLHGGYVHKMTRDKRLQLNQTLDTVPFLFSLCGWES
jgi:hypothetical protein